MINKPPDNAKLLINASKDGNNNVVENLVEKLGHGNVDKKDCYNWTALMYACKGGHAKIVEKLISAGAVINSTNPYEKINFSDHSIYTRIPTPLMLASEHGHTEIVNILIQAGANVNFTDKRNFNALGCAISNCKVEVVKLLLEKGADLEKISKNHESYPLLKIIGNLADDEIKVVANHLKDFKTIYRTTLLFRNFNNSKTLKMLDDSLRSKILVNSLPKELEERLGKDLTSKLVNNLLEMHSKEMLEKQEVNPALLAPTLSPPTLSPPTPPVQDEQPSGSPGCFSCIRIVVAKMLGSNSGIDRQ